jgi:hypothetical protein
MDHMTYDQLVAERVQLYKTIEKLRERLEMMDKAELEKPERKTYTGEPFISNYSSRKTVPLAMLRECMRSANDANYVGSFDKIFGEIAARYGFEATE